MSKCNVSEELLKKLLQVDEDELRQTTIPEHFGSPHTAAMRGLERVLKEDCASVVRSFLPNEFVRIMEDRLRYLKHMNLPADEMNRYGFWLMHAPSTMRNEIVTSANFYLTQWRETYPFVIHIHDAHMLLFRPNDFFPHADFYSARFEIKSDNFVDQAVFLETALQKTKVKYLIRLVEKYADEVEWFADKPEAVKDFKRHIRQALESDIPLLPGHDHWLTVLTEDGRTKRVQLNVDRARPHNNDCWAPHLPRPPRFLPKNKFW